MSISNSSSEADITTNGAVVWTLVGRVSACWPSVWVSFELVVILQDGVLLLNTVPWFLGRVGIENLLGEMPEVCVGWHEVLVGVVGPDVGLGENHNVVSSSEGIREEETWLEDDLRVLGCGLVGR